MKSGDEKDNSRKDEKLWWKKMLQKAHTTQGMKYPRTGIVGDKYSVTKKASHLIQHLEKRRIDPNDEKNGNLIL